jgi:hypothetical protein
VDRPTLTYLSAALVAAFASVGSANANLIINATMDPSLSSSAVTVITNAITFYQTNITTPVTVNIAFANMSSGLGSSTTVVYPESYAAYRADLVSNASGANDAHALATLPATSTNPVNGATSVNLKSANARAVGFAGAVGESFAGSGSPCSNSFVGDSCIGVRLAITNDTLLGTPGGYSLLSVVEHEIDEALGLGSELPDTTFLGGNPAAEDLFRYASPGVRSFAVNASCGSPPTAYLSIDGGVTNLDSFNNCSQSNGDYGDWVVHSPAQVQDWQGTPGATAFLTTGSPEMTALDVIGYTLAPEPTSISIMGLGLAGLRLGRRKRIR